VKSSVWSRDVPVIKSFLHIAIDKGIARHLIVLGLRQKRIKE
jgi:hypothetical protein